MNKDFTVVFQYENLIIKIVRLYYKNEYIARFDETNTKGNLLDGMYDYIRVYGYMAEFRRRRNNGEDIGWSDDLFVAEYN